MARNEKNKKINGLYAIVDTIHCPHLSHYNLAKKYLRGGAQILQLRLKNTSKEIFIEKAQEIVSLKKEWNFIFIVNDDPIIAKEVGADGVHVGQEDMSVSQARDILGEGKIIGKSTHSLADAQEAFKESPDYIAFGSVFSSKTKKFNRSYGSNRTYTLAQIVRISPVPVVAIGGINRSNIGPVIQTGVDSYALIAALTQGKDVVEETRYYIDSSLTML